MAQEAFDRLITVVQQRTIPSDTQLGRLVTPNGDSAMDETNDAVRVNVVAGAAAGGTSTTDDGAFTAAAGSGTPIMGFVTSDSVDAGDVGVIGMLANRQVKVTLYDSAGVELAVGGGTQYVEDAAAAANPTGTALNLVRDDARGGSLTTTDGDNVAARGTNAGELYVKHVDALTVSSHAVTNAGTFAVQVDGSALTALQLLDDTVFTDDAGFTPATSKILMIGAQADETSPDSVDEGDAGALRMTLDRLLLTQNRGHGKTIISTGASASSSGNNTLVSADASNKIKVKAFSLTTTSATAVTCIFQDGASGTELWRVILQAAASTSTGANLSVAAPDWLFATSVNTLLNLNLSGAITVHWALSYFKEAA